MFVALDEQRLDPLVFAVGRQIGADVERLAAAGGDRDDAVEDDDVADRPGQDRKDQRRRRRTAARPEKPSRHFAASPRTRSTARPTKAAPTSRYSGRDIAVRPNSSPGHEPRPNRTHLSPHTGDNCVGLSIRGPEEGEDRCGKRQHRRRLTHQLAGAVDERTGRRRWRRRRRGRPSGRAPHRPAATRGRRRRGSSPPRAAPRRSAPSLRRRSRSRRRRRRRGNGAQTGDQSLESSEFRPPEASVP